MIPSSYQQIDRAFLYILGFSVVILFLITAAMVYFAIRYRRDKHPVPADIRGNWQLEVVWTVIPTIIALSMFYFGWTSYLSLRHVPTGALEIEATGEMYDWIFVYPNGKESVGELVVPLGKPVKLNVTSADVLHSIFIPAFRIKVDAINGMSTYVWFNPGIVGEFAIMCTEFCGIGHSGMQATLRIVPEEEYQQWLLETVDDDWGESTAGAEAAEAKDDEDEDGDQ